MLKTLKFKSGKYGLSLLRDQHADVQEASEFMAACYDVTQPSSVSECIIRFEQQEQGKISHIHTQALLSASSNRFFLPPEALNKAHYQYCVEGSSEGPAQPEPH